MSATARGGTPHAGSGVIDEYLNTLFDRLAGTHADGRRMLADAEEHLLAAAAEGRAAGLSADEAERRAVQRFGSPGPLARQVPLAAMTMGTALRRAAMAGWVVTGAALLWYGVAGVLTWLLGWLWVRLLDGSDLATFVSCPSGLPQPDDCRELAHAQLFPPMWPHGARDILPAAAAGAALLVIRALLRRDARFAGPRWTPSCEAVTLGIAVPAGAGAVYLVPVGADGLFMQPLQAWALAYLCCGLLALLLCGATLYRWARHKRQQRSAAAT